MSAAQEKILPETICEPGQGFASDVVCEGEARMPTEYGEFRILGFRSRTDGEGEHSYAGGSRPPSTLVRVHSQCLTGDVFGSVRATAGASSRPRLPGSRAPAAASSSTSRRRGAGSASSTRSAPTRFGPPRARHIRGEPRARLRRGRAHLRTVRGAALGVRARAADVEQPRQTPRARLAQPRRRRARPAPNRTGRAVRQVPPDEV